MAGTLFGGGGRGAENVLEDPDSSQNRLRIDAIGVSVLAEREDRRGCPGFLSRDSTSNSICSDLGAVDKVPHGESPTLPAVGR